MCVFYYLICASFHSLSIPLIPSALFQTPIKDSKLLILSNFFNDKYEIDTHGTHSHGAPNNLENGDIYIYPKIIIVTVESNERATCIWVVGVVNT